MCTVILKNRQGEPSIAKEDIIVYKAGRKLDDEKFASVCMNYVYTKNKLHSVDFTYDTEIHCSDKVELEYASSIGNNGVSVVEGFHSYLNRKRCKGWINGRYIGKFIVPKGSKYYLNKSRNIVSNQIIFKEFLNN